ncbi:unnamed protein product, partial [Symbiodinium sp. KB8]
RWRRRLSLQVRPMAEQEKKQRRRWRLKEGTAWDRDLPPEEVEMFDPRVKMDFDHGYAVGFGRYDVEGDMVNPGGVFPTFHRLYQPRKPLSDANWYRVMLHYGLAVWYTYTLLTGALVASDSYHFLVSYLVPAMFVVPILLILRSTVTCRRSGICEGCCGRRRDLEMEPDEYEDALVAASLARKKEKAEVKDGEVVAEADDEEIGKQIMEDRQELLSLTTTQPAVGFLLTAEEPGQESETVTWGQQKEAMKNVKGTPTNPEEVN